MKFFSRAGQDQFLFEHFFRGKRNGVFVDAGAHDGEKLSHSLFFERFMDWRGLCIEPGAEAFAKLAAQRKCICEQAPVGKLAALLDKYSLRQVDYCSIDAQGAELDVLSELDLQRFNVRVLTICNAAADE